MKYQPLDNELLILPTTKTFPKGTFYLESYELFFLNFGYSVTDDTQLGFGIVFPLMTEFYQSSTFGIKQQILKETPVRLSAYGAYNPKSGIFFLAGVVGVTPNRLDLNLTLGIAGDEKGSQVFYYGLGVRADLSRKVSLVMEYANGGSTVTADNNNFSGLFSFGLRFRNNDLSWEIGGIRPLEDTGDFLFLPMLKAAVFF